MEAPFIDLINSDWSDWRGSGRREDRLDNPSWVDKFLSKWGLQVPPGEGPRLSSVLKDLRAVVASEVKRVQSGESLSPEGISRLDAAISGVRYRNHLSDSPHFGVESEPENKDSDWVVAQIAESFVDVLLKGDPKRLKICANPECGWLFYDDSRAMSRVWCDSRVCGNLMKVRRFRERSKKETSR